MAQQLNPTTPRSQTDAVVQGIKTMIIGGELRAGDRLPIESDLATRLGVSRGSLREGVRALSAMGVLTTRQGSGTYVTALDPEVLLAPLEFVVDLYSHPDSLSTLQIRRILETEAAGQAAPRITESGLAEARQVLGRAQAMVDAGTIDPHEMLEIDVDFHRFVAETAGNPVLAALISALGGRTMRARVWRSVAEESAPRSSHHEHLGILEALTRRDADRARTLMSAHLFGVEDFVRSSPPGRVELSIAEDDRAISPGSQGADAGPDADGVDA